jgi:hypothetical protein
MVSGDGSMVTITGTILDVPIFNQRNTPTIDTPAGQNNNLCWATAASMWAAFILEDEEDRTEYIVRLILDTPYGPIPNIANSWQSTNTLGLGITDSQRQRGRILTMEQIQETIGDGRPFGVLHTDPTRAGHWVLGVGYIEIPGQDPRVVYIDPMGGYIRSRTFDEFNSMPGNRNWSMTAQ